MSTIEPTRIGRYEIVSRLGKGGMAQVYLAYDPNMKRQVAIKVLLDSFVSTSEFLVRFKREAQTIASLEHYAIVPVYDYGEHNGQPFIVMRYMSGGSLADLIAQGPIEPKEIAKILERLTLGLDEAHSKGIIHRDLKPGNILFDQKGDPYIADFGIVKIAEQDFTTITARGAIVGTPAYMSPEQVVGQEELDGRSDIYSLGVVLFEMLTGKRPYYTDTSMSVQMMHVLKPIPNITDSRPGLNLKWSQVINKVLAKKAEDRYSTARELATDVSNLVQQKYPAQRKLGVNVLVPVGIISGISLICIISTLWSGLGILENMTKTPTSTFTTTPGVTFAHTSTSTSTLESSIVATSQTSTNTSTSTFTPIPTNIPTQTPTSTKTPTRSRTPTLIPSPTFSPTPFVIPTPELIAPTHGTYKSPITFEWEAIASVSYQVTLRHVESSFVQISNWIQGSSSPSNGF